MAHQIKDEKQEYQYSQGFTTPAGHQFHYYDTKENERLVMTHASGSHIEFKADGSIFIKSLKDLHLHSSVVSAASDGQSGASKGSELTSHQIGTDYTIDVQGTLKLKARSIQIEGHDTIHMLAGTDLEMKASNTWVRGKEQVAIEGTASIRMDTDECTQAFRTLRQDIGTEKGEDGKKGGLYKISNHGTFIIEQTDETAAMTLRSKGYMNLVCGQERTDWIGKYEEKPHKSATKKATWYQHVYEPEKLDENANCKEKPGSYYFESDAGTTYMLGQKTEGSCPNKEHGRYIEIKKGKDYLEIFDGDKDLIMHKGDYKEELKKGDHKEKMMKGKKKLTMMDGDWEKTQAKGDHKDMNNGNRDQITTGNVNEVDGNGKNETVGNAKTEKICKGMSGGGGGSYRFYNGSPVALTETGDVDLDCSIYACEIPPIPDSVPPLPNILPEDDSAQGSNGGGDEGGGGGGGGGMPSLPIGTLLQLLCGNFMNKASKLNIQNATKIFLN